MFKKKANLLTEIITIPALLWLAFQGAISGTISFFTYKFWNWLTNKKDIDKK